MKTIPVGSFTEYLSLVSQKERSVLLIYKEGSEQSECAMSHIRELDTKQDILVLTVNVNKVGEIHGTLGVDTAPSLVILNKGKVSNVIKGCQTKASYNSLITGRQMGINNTGEKKAKQVTVYSTPTCSWCTTLKTYLDSLQITYREINVAADTSAAESMVRKSGQQGVPQTEINGQMIVGFDKNRINQLLEI